MTNQEFRPCPWCGEDPSNSMGEVWCGSHTMICSEEEWNSAFCWKEIDRLENEAKIFYKSDGTFIQYEGDADVVGMRINAAKEVDRLERALKESEEGHAQTKEAFSMLEETAETLTGENDKYRAVLEDLKENGTRHDLNPTGVSKQCGHFEVWGDPFQYLQYMKSMDDYVKQKCNEALKDGKA